MTHPASQTNNQKLDADIIVVGAGLVGLAAAIAFAKQGKTVVLVDANPVKIALPALKQPAAWDARIYALTTATEDWLQTLAVWPGVDTGRVNAIDAMHVWNENDQKLALHCTNANLLKLGVIIENQNLMVALWQQINALGVTVITDAKCKLIVHTQHAITLSLEDATQVSAKLIVAADGVNSWVRGQANIAVQQKYFQQTAIVVNFLAEKNHQNIARQWFAPHATLALLPLPNQQVSMVWSLPTEQADELLSLSGEALAEKVALQSKRTLGTLQAVGKTLSFTLKQQTAHALIAERVVLVGDAAHQIHPMAGQGLNLGFRDVMQLTSLATKLHPLQDIGEYSFLRQFERARKADIATMHTLTTGLDYLFASDSGMIKKVTNWSLRQLNSQAAIKKLLIQQAA